MRGEAGQNMSDAEATRSLNEFPPISMGILDEPTLRELVADYFVKLHPYMVRRQMLRWFRLPSRIPVACCQEAHGVSGSHCSQSSFPTACPAAALN
jgi:hypothetical protein